MSEEDKIIYDDYEIMYANNDVEVKCLTTGKIYCSKFKTFNIIKQLQQENQQLKEALDKATKQSVTDHKYASECEDKVITYKSVLDEIREQLKKIKPNLDFEPWSVYKVSGDNLFDLLQILDKVGKE